MKIEDSQVTLSGERQATEQSARRETLSLEGKAWSFAELYARGRGAAPALAPAPSPVATPGGDAEGEMRVLRMLLALIQMLTGQRPSGVEATLPDGRCCCRSGAVPPGEAGSDTFSLDYRLVETHAEWERTTFSARGMVKTADGKTVCFDLGCALEREWREEREVAMGTRVVEKLKDPLMISFDGPAAALSDLRFTFDLDVDGTADALPMPARGSGWLAVDWNGDGRVTDGKELFGALSGDGFADLARYDADHNGWLDEGDDLFGRLLVWSGSDGERLETAASLGVGAIHLDSAATEFSLKEEGRLRGQVRASGVYLKEDGTAGVVRQVDVAC